MSTREKSTRIHQVHHLGNPPSVYDYICSTPNILDDSASMMQMIWDATAVAYVLRNLLDLAYQEAKPLDLVFLSRVLALQQHLLDELGSELELALDDIPAPPELFEVVERI